MKVVEPIPALGPSVSQPQRQQTAEVQRQSRQIRLAMRPQGAARRCEKKRC